MSGYGIPLAKVVTGMYEAEEVQRAIAAGQVSGTAPAVREFEARFSEQVADNAFTIACSSGTMALELCLAALDVHPGSMAVLAAEKREVVVPALAWRGCWDVVRRAGAVVRPWGPAAPPSPSVDGWNGTADSLPEMDESPLAVMVVHIAGRRVSVRAVLDALGAQGRHVPIIEDCAEALGLGGLTPHSKSTFATWSFFANKAITTGEGGMVATRDASLARRVRELRDHGMPREFTVSGIPGRNGRMSGLQAAFGIGQLRQLPVILRDRRVVARFYVDEAKNAGLQSCFADHVMKGSSNVCWQQVAVFKDRETRDRVLDALEVAGIEPRPFFPAYPGAAYVGGACAAQWAERAVLLPVYRGMTQGEVRRVVATVANALHSG